MDLQIACPGCGRMLQVGASDEGKQIRCPACQQISVVPALSENAGAPSGEMVASTSETATTWHMRTPEGAVYGPVSWSQVHSWVAEGRISADCELAESDRGPWEAATELIPSLSARASDSAQPPSSPMSYPYESGGTADATIHLAPHGGLLVFLGLLGFGLIGLCPVFSPIAGLTAWVMASRDLAEMRAGRMDKSGEGLTQAGWVMGIILSLLWMIVLLGASIIALVVGMAANW